MTPSTHVLKWYQYWLRSLFKDGQVSPSEWASGGQDLRQAGPWPQPPELSPAPQMQVHHSHSTLLHLTLLPQVDREALIDIPNVYNYQTFAETDKAGYIIRQWIASNLYDRIRYAPYYAHFRRLSFVIVLDRF